MFLIFIEILRHYFKCLLKPKYNKLPIYNAPGFLYYDSDSTYY